MQECAWVYAAHVWARVTSRRGLPATWSSREPQGLKNNPSNAGRVVNGVCDDALTDPGGSSEDSASGVAPHTRG